jgi:hypothetical protein
VLAANSPEGITREPGSNRTGQYQLPDHS